MIHIMQFFLVQDQVCKTQTFQKVSKPLHNIILLELNIFFNLSLVEVSEARTSPKSCGGTLWPSAYAIYFQRPFLSM